MCSGKVLPSIDHDTIPAEMWIEILSYLEHHDVLKVSATCKKLKYLCEDGVLWRQRCQKAGLVSESDPVFQVQETQSIGWKEVFKQRTRLKQNWRSGKFANFRLPHPDHPEEGHTDHVYAVQICGKVLVSGGLDGTVRTWDLLTQRLIDTEMRGHNSGVLSLQCDSRPQNDIILTGSSTGELISWRFSTRSAMRVLRHAHSAEVLDIKLDTQRKLVVTISADLTIKIWGLEGMYGPSNQPVEEPLLPSRVISGHQVWVNGIDLYGDTLVGACADGAVRVWNILDGTCVKTVEGERSVACIGVMGDRILCGGADRMVTVWDSRLQRAEEYLQGHEDKVTAVRFRIDKGMPDIIASGSNDGSIILSTDVSAMTRRKWRLKLQKALIRCQEDYVSHKAARRTPARMRRKTSGDPTTVQNSDSPAVPHTYNSGSDPHLILSLDFDSRWLVCGSTAREIVGWDFANRDPAILRSYSPPLLRRAHRRSITQRAFRQTGTPSHASIRTRYGRKSQKPRRLGFEIDEQLRRERRS